jgi:polar amino acid transport system ATP-binding protein
MSVLRNIALGLVKALRVPRPEAERSAMELLSRFGLADRAGEYPDRLSGGQQQRVAMIRALAFLADGQIVEEAPPAELFGAPHDERTQKFLRRVTDVGRL